MKMKFNYHYPADWPVDLKYPDDFILDGAASGTLIELAPKGYSAQLRYQGTPPQAIAPAAKEWMGDYCYGLAE